MLGESTSYFPAQLAKYWHSKGLKVVLITHQRDALSTLSDGTPVIRSYEHETRLMRLTTRAAAPVLYRLERLVPRFKQRFIRITEVSEDTELWLPYFVEYVTAAWPTSKAALTQHPRFVFGHEVTTYGLATALCRGVPKIIFPWGADVFTYAEASPFHYALTKFSLRSADLIVPSSTTAAHHISERFGVALDKIHPVSWGVDTQVFRRAEGDHRKAICAKWGIDPQASIVLNPRRFRPDWGAFVALEAFIRIASENPNTHFILFGGKNTEDFTRQAQNQVDEKGLSSRFTFLLGDAPISICSELMSIANIFVSLLGLGDMRSASVLQAVASGAAPVISDLPEYREMEKLGFAAMFVRPERVDDCVKALESLVRNPEKVREIVGRNESYIARHEDHSRQMEKMLNLITEVCARYRATR